MSFRLMWWPVGVHIISPLMPYSYSLQRSAKSARFSAPVARHTPRHHRQAPDPALLHCSAHACCSMHFSAAYRAQKRPGWIAPTRASTHLILLHQRDQWAKPLRLKPAHGYLTWHDYDQAAAHAFYDARLTRPAAPL